MCPSSIIVYYKIVTLFIMFSGLPISVVSRQAKMFELIWTANALIQVQCIITKQISKGNCVDSQEYAQH